MFDICVYCYYLKYFAKYSLTSSILFNLITITLIMQPHSIISRTIPSLTAYCESTVTIIKSDKKHFIFIYIYD